MKTELRKLAGLFSSRWVGPSVCEACGDEFSCGASLRGCWCSEIKLTDETRAELRSRFQSCLCPTCLERFAANTRTDHAVDS